MTGTLEAAYNESIVVDYIRHLWSSKHGLTREKDLYTKIKKAITSRQGAIDLSIEIADSSRIYGAILNTDHEMWAKFGPSAKNHMLNLNLLGLTQIRPLILAIIKKFSEKEVRKALRLLNSWGVRFLITGGGGGTLEVQTSARAKQISEGSITTAEALQKAMNGIVPADGEFESAFSVATMSKTKLARYYLRVLENQSKNQPEPELVPNPNQEEVNLEHILPLSPSASWAIDGEIARAFSRRFGNMVLLSRQENTVIGNAEFSQKKLAFAKSSFTLTSSVGEKNQWGIKEIEERQKQLAKLAVKAWPNKVI